MCDAAVLGKAALGTMVAGGIGETYAAYRKSAAEKTGYEYQSKVAKSNEQIAEFQAADALTRGAATVQAIQLKKGQTLGTQQAIFGSRNVALDEGSALNILADTSFMGARDEAIAVDNAAKEAWALRVQAGNYASNAEFIRKRGEAQSPGTDAASTALAATGRVASSWYAMRTRTSATTSPWGTV